MTMGDLKFTGREVVGIVLWVTSLVGLYYGLSDKITEQATATRQQTFIVEQQKNTIEDLRDRITAAEIQLRAQDRSLNELTVTLRVKRVIQ